MGIPESTEVKEWQTSSDPELQVTLSDNGWWLDVVTRFPGESILLTRILGPRSSVRQLEEDAFKLLDHAFGTIYGVSASKSVTGNTLPDPLGLTVDSPSSADE